MLKKTIMETVAGMLLITGLFMITRYVGLTVSTQSVHIGKDKPVVMLDAGHGGNDPGKVGVDGSLEKDINIAITLKLKEYLEQSDVTVILTRENKGGLYKEKDSHKKMADMKERIRRIQEADPDIVVSIHQNSYHQEAISGGQVFYYTGSEKAKNWQRKSKNDLTMYWGRKIQGWQNPTTTIICCCM